ncbi:MAG: hypothetical protein LBD23_03110 [Oscillospiraceae bacterium]|jgi:hypothetical protein|nr:hypothetical protein [Oscillospiraceae bacterium]
MQRDIEAAIKNARHIKVPDSTFERVENVLRSLEERKKTSLKQKYRNTHSGRPYKIRRSR